MSRSTAGSSYSLLLSATLFSFLTLLLRSVSASPVDITIDDGLTGDPMTGLVVTYAPIVAWQTQYV
jgi:hypothetical protein